MKRKKQLQNSPPSQVAPDTFLAHLDELKNRLFWVALCFTVTSAAAYPFFTVIIKALTAPLGNQPLYYMTPAGGLSFILKVCLYVGILGALPAFIYHLYKFMAPVMGKKRNRSVAIYTISSVLLACTGILFAYFISLPAALHFLTGFNLDKVSAMLTVDSYLSFIISYLIAGALLFQFPLIILIINSITPLRPKKMMGYQRHVIVGSFIFGAILSPTPDVVNQALLAGPIIIMYQLGILLVWLRNRKRYAVPVKAANESKVASSTLEKPSVVATPKPVVQVASAQRTLPVHDVRTLRAPRSIDGVYVRPHQVSSAQSRVRQSTSAPRLSSTKTMASDVPPLRSRTARTVDGFVVNVAS